MEKLLLVGSGGLGRVTLESTIEKYECYFIDDGYEIGTKICGTEIIGKVNNLENLFGSFKLLIVTIGDNYIRERVYKYAKQIGYEFPNIICSSAYISPYARVGSGCVILNNACVQNGSSVGDGVVINVGVEVHHDSSVDDFALIYSNSVIRTMAHVGKRVKIGSNVTISNSVVVADDETVENGATLFE